MAINIKEKCELTLLNYLHNFDNNIWIKDLALLLISIFNEILNFVNKTYDWISRFFKDQVFWYLD